MPKRTSKRIKKIGGVYDKDITMKEIDQSVINWNKGFFLRRFVRMPNVSTWALRQVGLATGEKIVQIYKMKHLPPRLSNSSIPDNGKIIFTFENCEKDASKILVNKMTILFDKIGIKLEKSHYKPSSSILGGWSTTNKVAIEYNMDGLVSVKINNTDIQPTDNNAFENGFKKIQDLFADTELAVCSYETNLEAVSNGVFGTEKKKYMNDKEKEQKLPAPFLRQNENNENNETISQEQNETQNETQNEAISQEQNADNTVKVNRKWSIWGGGKSKKRIPKSKKGSRRAKH